MDLKTLVELLDDLIWEAINREHFEDVESNFRDAETCNSCRFMELDDDEEGEERMWCKKHKREVWEDWTCDSYEP